MSIIFNLFSYCVKLLEPETVTIEDSCVLLCDEAVGGKRKRKEDERENNVKVAKKQKSNRSEENVSPAEQKPPRRGGRNRRGQRSRMKEEEDEMKEKTNPKLNSAPIHSEEDPVAAVDDLTLEADSKRKGAFHCNLPCLSTHISVRKEKKSSVFKNLPLVVLCM